MMVSMFMNAVGMLVMPARVFMFVLQLIIIQKSVLAVSPVMMMVSMLIIVVGGCMIIMIC